MDNIEIMKTIEKSVKDDSLTEAIDFLIANGGKRQKEEAILIAGNLSQLEKKRRVGVITDELYIIQRNKIRENILSVIHPKKLIYQRKSTIGLIVIITAIIVAILFYFFFLKSPEIKSLEKPRVIGKTINTDTYYKEDFAKFVKYNVENNGLTLDKIVQGESKDGRSLIFDIILKNNSENYISPDNFILDYCYHDGMAYSMENADGVIKPLSEYIQIIEIDFTDHSTKKIENELAIYPAIKIPPQDIISLRYQVHYKLTNERKYHPKSDWDIFFTLKLSYNNGELLNILPVVSWKNIVYSKYAKEETMDYYDDDEINWHKWIMVPSSMNEGRREYFEWCLTAFEEDDFFKN